MQYQSKTIALDNQLLCELRSPTGADAAEIIAHLKQTSDETDYMARYEDEIIITREQEESLLENIIINPKSIMISAFIEGNLVANAGFSPVASYQKYQHRAVFGISIKKQVWGIGIGSVLLGAIIDSARLAGFEQLELEVVSENARAIALYKKFGFETYGTRERSFQYRDGSYATEYLMLLKL